MAKKFELWMGVYHSLYPTGIMCCNKAAEVNRDYKKLCFISKAGNINYYVDKDHIPDDALKVIEAEAKCESEKFDKYVETELLYRPFGFYCDMLDCLNVGEYIKFLRENKGKTIADKIVALMPTYKARH